MEHCERYEGVWLIRLSDGSALMFNIKPRDRSEMNEAMEEAMEEGTYITYQDGRGALVIVSMRHVMRLTLVE